MQAYTLIPPIYLLGPHKGFGFAPLQDAGNLTDRIRVIANAYSVHIFGAGKIAASDMFADPKAHPVAWFLLQLSCLHLCNPFTLEVLSPVKSEINMDVAAVTR